MYDHEQFLRKNDCLGKTTAEDPHVWATNHLYQRLDSVRNEIGNIWPKKIITLLILILWMDDLIKTNVVKRHKIIDVRREG